MLLSFVRTFQKKKKNKKSEMTQKTKHMICAQTHDGKLKRLNGILLYGVFVDQISFHFKLRVSCALKNLAEIKFNSA